MQPLMMEMRTASCSQLLLQGNYDHVRRMVQNNLLFLTSQIRQLLTEQSCNWRKRLDLQKPKRRSRKPEHLHPTRSVDLVIHSPERGWKKGCVNSESDLRFFSKLLSTLSIFYAP